MKFWDFVEALATAERAAMLAELDEQAPEPVPELEWGAIGSVDEAQALAHELFPGRGEATAWLVDTVGISDRSARRWLQTGECPPGRETRLITAVENEANRRIRDANAEAAAAHAAAVAAVAAAGKGPLARSRLAASGASGVSVGVVEVEYSGADDDTRTVNEVDIEWDGVYAALDDDNAKASEEAFSWAVMDAYEPGLGDVLQIADYDHIELT